MPITLFLFVVFLIMFALMFLNAMIWKVKYQDELDKNLYLSGQLNPYQRKKYFLTSSEKELFKILQSSEIEDAYFIFPQLHLSTLLEVKDDLIDLRGRFDWLNKLYVDFVLFDRRNLEPRLVIELNDSTHKWKSRRTRDEFVKTALQKNNIPLLELETESLSKTDEVVKAVQNSISL